jgi:hypothetical protein
MAQQKRTIRANRPEWRYEIIDEDQKKKPKKKQKRHWVETKGQMKTKKKK